MLLWALLGSTFIGLCMQMIAARLGCASRQHLAEHCREQYPPVMRVLLWCMTELAIIGSDIQEVVGCSIGLFILFGTPLATGVVVTAATAFGFLYLERLGTRPLELFFGALIAVLAATMGGLFVKISPDQGAVLEGFLVPNMPPSAVQQVVGMVGCVIMPHNLFLHSALVQSRVVKPGEEAEAVFLFTIESAAAIVTSLLINTAVVAVFAKGFFGKEGADDIGLANAGNYLGDKYGGTLRVIWGLGLVAAGQSSTMTGAYAGQWVMQGYLDLEVKPWKRALVTRGMALVPTLGVAILFGDKHDALDQLNQYLNCLQSLVLPFALVPLLTFAGSVRIMGGLRLSWVSLSLGWAAAAAIMGTNVYLLIEQFSSDGTVSASLGLCLAAYLGLIVVVAWVGRLAVKKHDCELR
jgi:natural resistance-associated macrophage protein